MAGRHDRPATAAHSARRRPSAVSRVLWVRQDKVVLVPVLSSVSVARLAAARRPLQWLPGRRRSVVLTGGQETPLEATSERNSAGRGESEASAREVRPGSVGASQPRLAPRPLLGGARIRLRALIGRTRSSGRGVRVCETDLIEHVRQYPHLYDTRHKDYKDLRKCAVTWAEIARSLGCPEAWKACKERWRTLRDVYVRNKKSVMVGDKEGRPRWRFFDQMQFLNSYIIHKPTESDLYASLSGSSKWVVAAADVETVLCEDDTAILSLPFEAHHHDEDEDTTSNPAPPTPRPPRPPTTPTEDAKAPRRAAPPQVFVPQEEEELFGSYVAAAIRKLSAKAKSLAKMKIQRVLFEIEEWDR
ncbi:Transcription factor Adf-1 [Penaeus vannamei]|uniref:Transcription factor Adf-1 n=1 Tax=Penaeus vannamei TaxID=6689 RepID=A0A3R7M2E3_PENVA|nr:Transcription factor Adf-1 [Penaeus vannamei]